MNGGGRRSGSAPAGPPRLRLLLVSPRPPRHDGQGDQRRASVALTALAEDWSVEVVSWLPDVDGGRALWRFANPIRLMRAVLLATVRPLQVAYVQALVPRSFGRILAEYDVVLFFTDRAVPFSFRRPYVIDFIDDLGGAAELRASSSGPLGSAVWRWEARRLRRLDAKLSYRSLISVAVNDRDGRAISSQVRALPTAMATRPMAEAGTRVVFFGNLFYAPNAEAAAWICSSLAPRLEALGYDPGTILIAGRRPPPALVAAAAAAGVELRPDVPDLSDVLREAAVVIVPVILGSGVQNKVLDAVGAGRPCVVTPFTNEGVGLVDGRSALVRDRTPEAFADAVRVLLHDRELAVKLAGHAREQLARHSQEAVADSWRQCLLEAHRALVNTGPAGRSQAGSPGEVSVGGPATEGD